MGLFPREGVSISINVFVSWNSAHLLPINKELHVISVIHTYSQFVPGAAENVASVSKRLDRGCTVNWGHTKDIQGCLISPKTNANFVTVARIIQLPPAPAVLWCISSGTLKVVMMEHSEGKTTV